MLEDYFREQEQLTNAKQALRKAIHVGYEMDADASYLEQLDVALFALEQRELKINTERARHFTTNKN